MKHIKILIQMIRRCWIETVAATAVVVALMIPVLIAAGGAGVDITRLFLAKSRLCNALDAAILAASGSSGTEQELTDRMTAYINANYRPEEIGTLVGDIVPDFSVEDRISATASAEVDVTFISAVGLETITVTCASEVERNVTGIETALVLDVTGSMRPFIGTLRTATLNFINTIYERVDDPEDARIALVPYSAAVNVGPIAPTIVNDLFADPGINPVDSTPPDGAPNRNSVVYNASALSDNSVADQWAGCVMARPSPFDETDDDIATGGAWEAFWYEHTNDDDDNNWDVNEDSDASFRLPFNICNNRQTPNLVCPADEIVPLTSNRTLLEQRANDLRFWCRGGTLGNLGLVWAWRVLSPTPPFTEGVEYDDDLVQKSIIMMTDGQNQLFRKGGIASSDLSDFSAYGRLQDEILGPGINTRAEGLAEVNERFARICENIKAQGIIIYTVTFSSSINNDTRDLYRQCATDSTKYLDAPSEQDLIDAFEDIAEELSNLFITR